MKEKFTKYTVTQKAGMEGIGDMELEWLTPQETEQRWKEYREYQERCKQNGTYGQEYDLVIEIENDPTLSLKPKSIKPTESYKMVIIDFSDGRK